MNVLPLWPQVIVLHECFTPLESTKRLRRCTLQTVLLWIVRQDQQMKQPCLLLTYSTGVHLYKYIINTLLTNSIYIIHIY